MHPVISQKRVIRNYLLPLPEPLGDRREERPPVEERGQQAAEGEVREAVLAGGPPVRPGANFTKRTLLH